MNIIVLYSCFGSELCRFRFQKRSTCLSLQFLPRLFGCPLSTALRFWLSHQITMRYPWYYTFSPQHHLFYIVTLSFPNVNSFFTYRNIFCFADMKQFQTPLSLVLKSLRTPLKCPRLNGKGVRSIIIPLALKLPKYPLKSPSQCIHIQLWLFTAYISEKEYCFACLKCLFQTSLYNALYALI